jgi:sulfite exporter TauE/SafE
LIALVLAVFVASLLGSLHCAGMCGPFVAFATLRTKDSPLQQNRGPWRLQFAYHAGRLLAYASLGALAGVLGAALNLGGSLVGIGRLAGVGAGLLLVIVGASRILGLFGVKLPELSGLSLLRRAVALGSGTASRLAPVHRAWAIGLVTALLPCGWLYAFVAIAAGTGNAQFGVVTMLAFWFGTVPILAGIGAGIGEFAPRFGRAFQFVVALVVIGFGLHSIAGRWTIPASRRPTPTTSIDAAVQRVAALLSHRSHGCH